MQRQAPCKAPGCTTGSHDNHCYKWAIGDKGAVDAAFANAAHVTKLDLVNNRLIPNAMEPRAAIGSYSRANDEYTLYVSQPEPARRAAADDGLCDGPA